MAKKTQLYMSTFSITIPWLATSHAIARRQSWAHIKKVLCEGALKYRLDEIPVGAPNGATGEIMRASDLRGPWTTRSKIPNGGFISAWFATQREKAKAAKATKKKGGSRKKKQ